MSGPNYQGPQGAQGYFHPQGALLVHEDRALSLGCASYEYWKDLPVGPQGEPGLPFGTAYMEYEKEL